MESRHLVLEIVQIFICIGDDGEIFGLSIKTPVRRGGAAHHIAQLADLAGEGWRWDASFSSKERLGILLLDVVGGRCDGIALFQELDVTECLSCRLFGKPAAMGVDDLGDRHGEWVPVRSDRGRLIRALSADSVIQAAST
ncbi:hypothetical protein CCR91_10490 [Thiorhodovibrio winogradskyi]|nr:hypothetical protein [Thiorhodovibrio winogradskyi]